MQDKTLLAAVKQIVKHTAADDSLHELALAILDLNDQNEALRFRLAGVDREAAQLKIHRRAVA